jgi:LmbE family N-acetylglucosaminyl deacetylase
MLGWDQNAHEESFVRAQVEEAAMLLAEVLREEQADLVTGYDWHGGYGHPDHVKVHAVAKRAAELAGTRRYLETTMNRDGMRRLYEAAVALGVADQGWNPDTPMDDGNPLGTPEAELHWAVDVMEHLELKRSALAAHASQGDARGMLEMPDDAFAVAFGAEHFIEPGRPEGMVHGWFLDA